MMMILMTEKRNQWIQKPHGKIQLPLVHKFNRSMINVTLKCIYRDCVRRV